MWLADSLRLSEKYQESTGEYIDYLRLSNFDSKLGGQMNYYVMGYLFGVGRKKRAAQTDTWRDLRSLAFFGLCDSERNLMQYEPAIAYCQKSLAYDKTDPYTHYAVGLCYMHQAQSTGSMEALSAAQEHFRKMVEINPELEEVKFAKANLRSIDAALSVHP